jgi:alpha-tubulin suppressor-like RCC1 family protein
VTMRGKQLIAITATLLTVAGGLGLVGYVSASVHSRRAISLRALVAWGENSHAELGAGYTSRPEPVTGVVGLPADVKRIALGDGTGYALTSTGILYSWGGNQYGQLGVGYRSGHSAAAVRITSLSGVKQVAAGGTHAMALLANGDVEVWGSNLYGELGNGTTTEGHEIPGMSVSVPQLVPGLHHVVEIAAGGPDDVARLSNGAVMAWGENRGGQLGDGTLKEKTVPTLTKFTGVRRLAIGGFNINGGHMLALLKDRTLSAAGSNDQGQLGDGTTVSSPVPVKVRGLTGVTAVSADVSHSLALTEGGVLYAWGSNTYGQLGVASPEKCEARPCSLLPIHVPIGRVSAIAAGFRYSLAITGGTVYGWGWNTQWELGDGTDIQKGSPTRVVGVKGVLQIAAGKYHAAAVINGPAPLPRLEATASNGTVTLLWRPGPTETNDWRIKWRAMTHPASTWKPPVVLPASAREYTISGLTIGQPYEFTVNNQGGMAREVDLTP